MERQEKAAQALSHRTLDNRPNALDVSDIDGARSKPWLRNAPAREVMKVLEDRKSRPKFVIARDYEDNNTFDYSDVNFSRRHL